MRPLRENVGNEAKTDMAVTAMAHSFLVRRSQTTWLVSEPMPSRVISTVSPGVTATNVLGAPLMITSPAPRGIHEAT